MDKSDGRYVITDLPRVGKGVLAADNFTHGELIMRERPLLVFPQRTYSTMGGASFWDVVASEMPESLRKSYRELYNCRRPNLTDFEGIAMTNALRAGRITGEDESYGVVGAQSSRFNHSCTPNAHFSWNPNTFASEVRANRPIKKGEEVTIAYTNIYQPYDERQRSLKTSWRFSCACVVCSQPGSREYSDKRRPFIDTVRMFKLQDRLMNNWLADASQPRDAMVRLGLLYAAAAEHEKVVSPDVWLLLCRLLVKAYCAVNDAEGARMWAQRAAAHTVAFMGSHGGWLAVARAPERTEWWGLRAKRCHL
ncbi:SET domain-containing protein [Artomyces pyxidatus]|uniref:SET domain-containing protein n=1 Tax=Artomyces pyxidatus TaxID=48021 RepID=A0ACB8T4N9_9AGAM|nr:SET domain-containing protein [Artomyces pyxidatus]